MASADTVVLVFVPVPQSNNPTGTLRNARPCPTQAIIRCSRSLHYAYKICDCVIHLLDMKPMGRISNTVQEVCWSVSRLTLSVFDATSATSRATNDIHSSWLGGTRKQTELKKRACWASAQTRRAAIVEDEHWGYFLMPLLPVTRHFFLVRCHPLLANNL